MPVFGEGCGHLLALFNDDARSCQRQIIGKDDPINPAGKFKHPALAVRCDEIDRTVGPDSERKRLARRVAEELVASSAQLQLVTRVLTCFLNIKGAYPVANPVTIEIFALILIWKLEFSLTIKSIDQTTGDRCTVGSTQWLTVAARSIEM